MPQFFLVVLIIFCTVTFRSGDSLKKPIFLFQLSFQRSTSFHTTCSLLLFSFLVRDWLSHFLTQPLQKWLRRQFQSMLGLLIQTTPLTPLFSNRDIAQRKSNYWACSRLWVQSLVLKPKNPPSDLPLACCSTQESKPCTSLEQHGRAGPEGIEKGSVPFQDSTR